MMSDTERHELSALAKVVIVLAIIMVVCGILWYGIEFATIARILRQIAARPGRAMWFRFILQPTMALIAAVNDARRDVRLGRAPFMWTMLHRPAERIERLHEAANATARIMLLGLVMDAIYQLIELDQFFPAEAVIIALVLAFLPYVALRGVALRIIRRWHGSGSARQA